MEGKIFNDSANIYQDQAKILYEYYKNAAEKIVSEEMALEGMITNAEYQIEKYTEDLEKTKSQRTICWILSWTIVGLIIGLIKNSRVKELERMIESKNEEIGKLQEAHSRIFRDYRVTKMGVAYVPVAKRVAYNDKSFIVDQSGIAGNEKFTLQIIKQNDLINEAVADLQALSKSAPIVENSKEPETVNTGELSRSIQKINFNDYFGRMDRTLRTVSYSLGNTEEYNVELPVVFPDTEYAAFLNEYSASDAGNAPIFNIFNTKQYDENIRQFNALNETRKSLSNRSEQIDKVLKTLMVNMADAVQATAAKKMTSAANLVDYSNRILFNILKAPYNFYSPVLEAEEIERISQEKFDYESVDFGYKHFNLRESSKVKLDLHSMNWVAEDGGRTTVPFGISQIQYEIIGPIVSNLLKDTKKDRMDIYNHIKDQKLSYLTKWHQDTEDFYGRNRAEASDIINLMRSTLSEYSAAYNTLVSYKKTEEAMENNGTLESAVTEAQDNSAEVLMGYKAQEEQVKKTQKEFEEYMERLHEDIDARAEKFGYVEYYDASLRDKTARDTAVAAGNVNMLDERRKPLAEVNPLLAQTSELLPTPNIEEDAYKYAGINLNTVARESLESLNDFETYGSRHTGEAPAFINSSIPVVDDEEEFDADNNISFGDAPEEEAQTVEREEEYDFNNDNVEEEPVEEEEFAEDEEEFAEDEEEFAEDEEEPVEDEEEPAEEEDEPAEEEEEPAEEEDEPVEEEDEPAEEEEEPAEEEEEPVEDEEEPAEEEDEEELSIDDIAELLDELRKADPGNQYGVEEMSKKFEVLLNALDLTEDEDKILEIQESLIDIYNRAVDIRDHMSNR